MELGYGKKYSIVCPISCFKPVRQDTLNKYILTDLAQPRLLAHRCGQSPAAAPSAQPEGEKSTENRNAISRMPVSVCADRLAGPAVLREPVTTGHRVALRVCLIPVDFNQRDAG